MAVADGQVSLMSDAPHAVVSADVTNENPTPSFTANKIGRDLLGGAQTPKVLVTPEDPNECRTSFCRAVFDDGRDLLGGSPSLIVLVTADDPNKNLPPPSTADVVDDDRDS